MSETEARQQFQSQLLAEKERARAQFESELAQRTASERLGFERQVAMQIVKANRELARAGQQALSLRQVQQFRQEQWRQFGTQTSEWQRKAKEEYESGLGEWERAEQQRLEEEISRAKVIAEAEAKVKQPSIQEKPSIQERPKGIAETLLAISPKPVLKGFLPSRVWTSPFGLATEREKAFEPLAGLVASVESPVYSFASLIGIQTPRPPPTAFGAGISTAGLSILSGKVEISPEAQKLAEYGGVYAVFTGIGDILLTYGIGKAVAASPIGKPIAKVEAAITKPITGVWKGSRPEMWLIRQSEWYAERAAKGLAPQIVSIPRTAEVFGMEALEREATISGAWELMQTPRTAGLLVTPAAIPLAERIAEKEAPFVVLSTIHGGVWTYKTMETKPAPILELLKSRKGEMSLTRLLTTPKELPKLATTIFGAAGISPKGVSALGIAGFIGLRGATGILAKPSISEKAISIVTPKVATMQRAKAVQLQKQVAIQMQKQVQVASTIFQMPTPPRQRYQPTSYWAREQERLRRMPKIRSPRQVLFGKTEYKFPVMEVKGAAKYVFSKR